MAPLAQNKSLDLTKLVTAENLAKNKKPIPMSVDPVNTINNISPVKPVIQTPQQLIDNPPPPILRDRPRDMPLIASTDPVRQLQAEPKSNLITKDKLKQVMDQVAPERRHIVLRAIISRWWVIEWYNDPQSQITQAPVPVAPQFPLWWPQGQQNDIAEKLFWWISNYQKWQSPAVERLVDSVTPLWSVPWALWYTSNLWPAAIRTAWRFAQWIAWGLESTIEWAWWLLEKWARKLADTLINPFLTKEQQIRWNQANDAITTFKTPASSDLLALWEWVWTLGSYVWAPLISAWLSALPETKVTAKIWEWLWKWIDRVWETTSVLPWIKQFRESLPQGDKDRFDQFLGWSIIALAWWLKWKSNIYKNPKLFIKENINPAQVMKNFQENVLSIPSNVSKWAHKIPTAFEWAWQYVAKKSIDSKFKFTKPTKEAIRKITWGDVSDFILSNNLQAWSVDDMIENTRTMVDDAMISKLSSLESYDKPIKIWEREKIIANSIVRQAKNDISEIYWKSFEEIGPNEVIPELKDTFDIINNVDALSRSTEAKAIQLEWLKSLYDAYNSHYKYDPTKTRILSAAEKVRLWLQDTIEWVGKEIWIDIKWLNKKIAWGKALEKWLIQAWDRMDNNNMFWLSDTQTAILSSVLWGWPVWVSLALLWKAIMDNLWFRSWIAWKLYPKKLVNEPIKINPNTPISSRTAGGNISNQFSSSNPSRNFPSSVTSLVPKSEWNLVKWPDFIAWPPKKISQIIEKWLAKQPSTTKILEWLKKVSENQWAKQAELVGKGLGKIKQWETPVSAVGKNTEAKIEPKTIDNTPDKKTIAYYDRINKDRSYLKDQDFRNNVETLQYDEFENMAPEFKKRYNDLLKREILQSDDYDRKLSFLSKEVQNIEEIEKRIGKVWKNKVLEKSYIKQQESERVRKKEKVIERIGEEIWLDQFEASNLYDELIDYDNTTTTKGKATKSLIAQKEKATTEKIKQWINKVAQKTKPKSRDELETALGDKNKETPLAKKKMVA